MELRQQIIADIERLPEEMLRAVNIFLRDIIMVEFKTEVLAKQSVRPPFKFGCLKGKIQIADDFDEEMDEYGRFASEPDFGQPVKEVWE